MRTAVAGLAGKPGMSLSPRTRSCGGAFIGPAALLAGTGQDNYQRGARIIDNVGRRGSPCANRALLGTPCFG